MNVQVWLFSYPSISFECTNKRIQHECEGRIEKSITRISVWHHDASQIMSYGNPEGWIFLSYPHTSNGIRFLAHYCFYAPAIYNGGGAYSITLVRTSVRTYIRTYICTSRTSCPVRTKNGFRAISFENIDIIIKYRSSSIMDKIHQLLSELWPLISEWKMVSGQYLLKTVMYSIHISYTGI